MMEQSLRLEFNVINNFVEYKALIVGMCFANHLGEEKLNAYNDP